MLLFIVYVGIIFAAALWWLARDANSQLAEKLGLSGVVSWYRKREKSQVAVIFFGSVILFTFLWWLVGDASNKEISHKAEFGLLLFDSLLAMVIFILGVGGIFGYRSLKEWVESETRKTTVSHLSDDVIKKQIKEIIQDDLKKVENVVKESMERHIETDEFKAKLQKLVSEKADFPEEKTKPSSTQETKGANKSIDRGEH